MEEQSKPQQKQTKEPHDSNPFTTTITGVKKLFEFNMGSLISVNVFSVLLYFIMGIIAVAMVVGVLAFIINNTNALPLAFYLSYPDLANYAASISDSAIFATWAIGAIVILLIGVLAQATQAKLAIESAKGQTIKLGAVLKSSFKRIPALLGLMLIPLVAMIAVALVLFLFMTLPQPINILGFILIPVVIVLGFYLVIRLVFSNILVIDESIGPINALKRSWAISSGHFGEILGVIAASTLMIAMPISFLQSLLAGSSGALINILQLIVGLISMVSASLMLTALAQRLVQLRNAHDNKVNTGKTHNMNHLAVVFLIIASFIIGSISEAINPDANKTFDIDFNSNSELDLEKEFKDFEFEFNDSELKIN